MHSVVNMCIFVACKKMLVLELERAQDNACARACASLHVRVCSVRVCVLERGTECIRACLSVLFQCSVTDSDQSLLTSPGHGAISACGLGS